MSKILQKIPENSQKISFFDGDITRRNECLKVPRNIILHLFIYVFIFPFKRMSYSALETAVACERTKPSLGR